MKKTAFLITICISVFLLSSANAGTTADAAPMPVQATSSLQSLVPALLAGVPTTDTTQVETGEKSPLRIVLVVQKIYLKNGVEHRMEAGLAAPGDLLEYRAEYKNTGNSTLKKVVLTLPLPDQSSFINGSAQPAAASASTKDKRTLFRTLASIDAALQADAAKRAAREARIASKRISGTPVVPSMSDMASMPLAPALSVAAPKEQEIAALQWSVEKMSPNQIITVSARVRVDGAS